MWEVFGRDRGGVVCCALGEGEGRFVVGASEREIGGQGLGRA